MFHHRQPVARRRSNACGPKDRRGTATVEFAFSASITFFLFLAMIEVGRFHVVRHSMDQAVYMGARTGIVPGATTAQVEQIVADRLRAAGVLGATIAVSPGVIDTTTRSVTVAATTPYDQNSWALPKFFGGLDVAASITLDHENVAFD
ncbi:TadE/TadG family type IV pilus assembly protein [Botrimarina hoheduenensis]|uniref:TadE-like protein n=1 Tax=Botrimarina hoheduenensis TaxID=2528000 RepID=A0A5C5WCM8_9BACT|nr:TadE/TadG family type IV pilus assembly protein [Botrimarina hoheduenensis]TWT48678.1 TadE-like protein [Botrimarina hoheduenensis]